jgi:hypothetical protein
VLYGAGLADDTVVLGHWQRAAHALDGDACAERGVSVLRRSTGGPTARAGDGVVYFALALRHASVLMGCPPDRVLNRNLRGLLGGLSSGGAAAHYFGREWLSVARRPVALVGWDRLSDGRVLVEAFVAHARSFVPDAGLGGYPKPETERFLGKEPITLADASGREHPIEQLVRWVAEGHPARFGSDVSIEQSSLTDDQRSRARERKDGFLWQPDERRLHLAWSPPIEIPIGWLAAGVRTDESGLVADVDVAGDFYQDHAAPDALRARLVGHAPSAELYAEAVNATWDGSKHVIEGLKSLEPIREALLRAAPG